MFANDGKLHFTQEYFFPLYGAYKALAEGCDQDGDLDITAISFFPDCQRSPTKSFVYLENQGDLQFNATSFPTIGDYPIVGCMWPARQDKYYGPQESEDGKP